jgi:hypothetical protein
VGGSSEAKIGSVGKNVYVNGGGASTSLGNVLRVGNGDATGDVLGTIQLDNGRLSLNRNDTFTLSAKVAGTKGGGLHHPGQPHRQCHHRVCPRQQSLRRHSRWSHQQRGRNPQPHGPGIGQYLRPDELGIR